MIEFHVDVKPCFILVVARVQTSFTLFHALDNKLITNLVMLFHTVVNIVITKVHNLLTIYGTYVIKISSICNKYSAIIGPYVTNPSKIFISIVYNVVIISC